MKVAIVNYGMGNLGSVCRALERLGVEVMITTEPSLLAEADRIVLPGVGSFSDGMAQLKGYGWVGPIRAAASAGKPVLGICLGMQLLATAGTEWGDHLGLDLIPGHVRKLDALGCPLRIPHIGWNDVFLERGADGLFRGISSGEDFYFVHSFAFDPGADGDVLARTEYGISFVAAIRRGNVFGTQFHPEKSSKAGMRLLKNFLDFQSC